MKWQWQVLGAVCGGALLLGAGILLGHFAVPRAGGGRDPPRWLQDASGDLDEKLIQDVMGQVESARIRENLRVLASRPHLATTPGDRALVQLLRQRWQDPQTGLDGAAEGTYDVLLSFPDPKRPNSVSVCPPVLNGSRLFESQRSEKALTPDQAQEDVVPPYAAYAPSGSPQGRLVYAHQGTRSDYETLVGRGLDLNGTIAIVRYGGAGRATKAVVGAEFGVAGLVVYTDPKDINDGRAGENDTYPNSWHLPPSGVERGSYTESFGDLLTPYHPAKGTAYDAPGHPGIPPIPTQPIGFEDARTLICEVQVSVYNQRVIKKSANVMGFIRGSQEPDRYVLYGNHRDSWVHGAVDPGSGTAVMLEITRVLGKMLKEGTWRPRRSIIFGSWGAEEFGLIGSTEYTEEFSSKLQARSVAYINVDISVFGGSFCTSLYPSNPCGQHAVPFAVPAPGSGTGSVYDNWRHHTNRSSPTYGVIPSLGSLGAGSDYASFIHYLGITSMDLAYTYDRSQTSARIYPAYHTAFDTFDYTDRFIDPGFTSHQAVARTAGNVLLRLADSLVLPLNVSDYGEALEGLYSVAAQGQVQADLVAHNISLAPLKVAIDRFKTIAADFNQRVMKLKEDPLEVRMVNDQIMLLERAFLDPRAFPNKYYYSHVLWAPRAAGVPTFPGLAEAHAAGDWDAVRKHLSIATQAVESAASTLEPPA
uniref:Aminopeptidase NAALADL1 n=1 Tax=Crocodylus porosus TaxID=8502 RepID=A0A7M4E732_CROPO